MALKGHAQRMADHPEGQREHIERRVPECIETGFVPAGVVQAARHSEIARERGKFRIARSDQFEFGIGDQQRHAAVPRIRNNPFGQFRIVALFARYPDRAGESDDLLVDRPVSRIEQLVTCREVMRDG